MTPSLIAILLAFFAIMVGVLVFCLRERKRALLQRIVNPRRDEDDDNRIAMVIFGAIIVGAALALITAYVVFFRQWS
jgi:hypothetical protein